MSWPNLFLHWMEFLVCLEKNLQVPVPDHHYLEIFFFADQVAVDQFVQEHEVMKPGNIKEVRMSCCWKTYTIFKNCMEF